MRITRPRSWAFNAARAAAKASKNSVFMTYLPQQEYALGYVETIEISEGFGIYRTIEPRIRRTNAASAGARETA